MAWAVISTLGIMGRGLEPGAGCLPGNECKKVEDHDGYYHHTLPPDGTPLASP